MGNFFKQIGFAAITVGLTIATGGAFAGLSAGGAGFFGGIANAFVSLGLKGFATRVATQFFLGAAIQALGRATAKEQIGGTLVSGRDPIASRKVIYGTRRVGGTQVFLGTRGAENKFLYMVMTLAAHEVTKILEVYFGDDRVYYWDGSTWVKDTTSDYYDANDQELFNIGFFEGQDDQPAPSNLVSEFTEWTSDHRLRGVAHLVVQLKYDPNKYANGIPNITSVVIGKEVYDPVNDVTGHTDNAAMCLLDYLRNDEFGLGVADEEIDFDSFADAALVCGEQVALDGGGTEKRYTINGVVDTSASPKQIIEDMLASMGGKLVYAAGQFKLLPAEYRSPAITLDEDDIISDIDVMTKNSVRDFYNGVRGVFSDPGSFYQPVEYPTVESSTYQSIDGLTRYTQLDLPFTTSSATAQRLAKILLNQSRQELTIQMRCKLSALNITVGDNIYVNNTRLGFTNKVFEVGSVSISPEADGTLGVDIMAREINSSTYDWTATDEQALITNAAPYSNNFDVPPPTNLVVSSQAVISPDGTASANWEISWDASEARNLANYEIQWKTSAESGYHSTYTRETSWTGVGNVTPGQQYAVRVRAITSTGAASEFDTATHVMSGDSSAPATPTGLTATGGLKSIELDWDANTESDLRGYYVYENTTNNPSTASLINRLTADRFTRTNLADSTVRYYWVSAVDFTGNESSKSSVATATTDAGIDVDDTKSASGYVYYTLQSSGQPGTPSASSFSFNDLTFTGLSSFWDETPPQIAANQTSRYWASQYNVEDVNGVQTIVFTDPFRSFYLDGLITFSNLQNEVNGGTVTTIDGGNVDLTNLNASNITTGTLTSNVVYTGVLELDDSQVGAGKTFVDPQWGFLTAAFALESENNSSGLYVSWDSSAGGQAIYGNATGNNYGAAVVGVNESSPSSLGCWGGFFQTTQNSLYTRGLVGITNNTDQTSAGGEFYAPYGGVGAAVRQGTLQLGKADSSEGAEIRMQAASGLTPYVIDISGGNQYRVFYQNGTTNPGMVMDFFGNLSISGNYSPFTGSHLGLITEAEIYDIGDIAIDSGSVYKNGVSDTITDVSLSDSQSSKKAIGVFASDKSEIQQYAEPEDVDVQDYNGNTITSQTKEKFDARLSHFTRQQVETFIQDGKRIVSINSLGEGQINVCGENGAIEQGDLIVTSSIAGKGMKQSDDIVRSITVAKARESVTFSDPSEIKQIACIYLCG